MADDSIEEAKHQVYLNYRELTNLYYDYDRNYIRSISDPPAILMSAKACFFKQKYSDCKKLLQRLNRDHNTKILYQAQTLLFKVTYLLEPNNIADLEKIIRDFERMKNRCPGRPFTQFHNQNLKQMLQIVIRGKEKARNSSQLNKQQIRSRIKAQQNKKQYEGLPSYLVSVSWNNKFNQFIQNNGPYPGPITNFEIINHVFELEPHEQPSKDYMDKILFPFTENSEYVVVKSRQWAILQQIFVGNPVKRIFVADQKTRQITGGDNLIKTLIQYDNSKIVMQWQYGTYWDKSILPLLTQKFGPGQLKQQTRNKDYIIIPPGKMQQPFTCLKYVRVDPNLIKSANQKQQLRKKNIMNNYDMQKYNPDESRQAAVGLANLVNTCYMNAALQMLGNLKSFTNYFSTNKYLSQLNINDANKDGSFGQVTCAYADLIKRLWYSPKQTRYIDPTIFKKVFGERYDLFDGNEQQDAQQFLMFFLNCLHEDLNENQQMSIGYRESMGGKAFDTVRNSTITHYNKHNKSIISQLFHGFYYHEIMCDQCEFKTYRFQHNLMVHIQVPPDAPKLTVFMVEAKNITQAKRTQVYIKKLQKISQVIQILSRHFLVSPQNDLQPFMFYDDYQQWQPLKKDADISAILKKQSKNGSMILYEIPKPQSDEQIAMISQFIYDSNDNLKVDAFPRFLPIKKIYKDKEYIQELSQIIFSTYPTNKFRKQKKQYLKQVKPKKVSKKFYQCEYKVILNSQLSNFDHTSINKTLGENEEAESVSLQGCLQRMGKQQTIDIKQGWTCQRCKQVRKAHKTDKIYSVGKYLIVQLKRFTQNNVKITTKIEYPINNLNLRPYIYDNSNNGVYTYNLSAVILHRGSLNSGHYTCICRNKANNCWLLYDDESVRTIQQNLVVDTNAYILLYEKSDISNLYISN